MHVVATAGHVDHGKSTLVRALTGIDPDRFAEEKERGLTIDLGFAHLDLPSGRGISFVDVPGHVRFIKNMLAGVGAVDACLFVVAATEGWKPQSEEHLRVLELLGLESGVVALTKCGLVDDELRELARLDVEEHVARSFLAGAPIVEVDAVTGPGVDALIGSLDRLTAATPTAADRERPRLWIDRVFAAAGAGTVVTGTLTGGRLAIGDELVSAPVGRPVRVRGLQRHHEAVEEIAPGNRVAVNLAGVDHTDLGRGHALIRSGQWHLSATVDAEFDVLDTAPGPLSRRGAHLAYIGSGEHPVRVRVLGPDAIDPGSHGAVRLHLPTPLPLVMGDRLVLRDAGPGTTIGGAVVRDVDPVRKASAAAPDASIDRIVSERGWTDVDELERLTGERRPPDLDRWVVDRTALGRGRAELADAIDRAGALGLDVAALDDRQRAVLGTLDDVAIEAGRARRAAAPDPLADHPYLAALIADPFSPPSPEDAAADRAEVRELVKRGLVVELDGVWFAAGAIDDAADRLRALLEAEPDGVTISAIRDTLGTTRKFVIPLMSHFDATGRTRRRGDLRIAGPRL